EGPWSAIAEDICDHEIIKVDLAMESSPSILGVPEQVLKLPRVDDEGTERSVDRWEADCLENLVLEELPAPLISGVAVVKIFEHVLTYLFQDLPECLPMDFRKRFDVVAEFLEVGEGATRGGATSKYE